MAQLFATFDVAPVPGSHSMQPIVDYKQYDTYWTFNVTPCRFAVHVTVSVLYGDPTELIFKMEYNNSGVKLFNDEKVYKIPGLMNPNDLKIEGYRTKTITLTRPPADDDVFFI
eukprot:TRINITY_DN19078_c0_g1_i1.p1 TRINITY_DN19078_c0_g1~~TRINITY_DN19078_c0_g1_i1.p1  ORF type:complete len:113 (+),score=13.12 TRINITY_DN19078_c0_g1_i1:12-350(+)